MNNSTIVSIVMAVLLVIMIIVLIWFITDVVILLRLQKRLESENKELRDLREANKDKILDNSKQLLEFIRMMVGQVAVMKFRTFVDSRDLGKTTKVNVEKLIQDIATTVNNSLNMTNISIENTMYSREFFESYIVETSVIMVKDLLDKASGNDEEEY